MAAVALAKQPNVIILFAYDQGSADVGVSTLRR